MLDSSVTTRHCACLKEFMVSFNRKTGNQRARGAWERHLPPLSGVRKENFQKEVQRHGSNAGPQCPENLP